MAFVESTNSAVQMSQHPRLEKLCVSLDQTGKVEGKSKNKDLGKTKLCVYFAQGKCGLGRDCKFAHSASEIRSVPNLAKTQLCTNFMNGTCTNGNCNYAHGEAELVNPPNFKKKPCSWYAQGKCRNGANCRFSHSSIVEPPPGIEPVEGGWQGRANVADNMTKSPPWGRAKAGGGDDWDASTNVPSTCSLAETGGSMTMATAPMPEENLYRMMAGRGSAPLQNQVASMNLAIGDLQAKLSRMEGKMAGPQVQQMQQTIKQLSEQCEAMEERLRKTQQPALPMQQLPLDKTQQPAPTMERPAWEKASPIVTASCKGAPSPAVKIRPNARASALEPTRIDDVTKKGPPPPVRKAQVRQQNGARPQPKTISRNDWWQRAALGALTVALMVMVEMYNQ